MAELKPCPKCGGEVYTYSDGLRVWWGAKCSKCLIESGEYRTEQEAIEAWSGAKVEVE